MEYYKLNGGRKRKPVIAIVGPRDRLGKNEYKMTVDFLKKRGHKAFHIEPKEVEIGKDKRLKYKNVKIDIVRRAAEIRYFKTRKSSRKIFESYKKNKAIIFNDFHNRLWGIKSIFAILKDKKFEFLFTEKEVKAIKETIPDTFIVSVFKKNIRREEYWKRKDSYVLKPSDMSEAKDIIFGKDVKNNVWKKMLLSKKCNGWTVQRVIDIKKRKVVILENGKKIIKNLYTDFSIYAFMGKKEKLIVGGIANRTSELPVVNVARGGGINEIKIIGK